VSLILLIGGARSGKSALALELAGGWGGPVVFVATGQPGDAEMEERIRRHCTARPAEWATIEEPTDLVGALVSAPDDAAAVVDCLSLWVANRLGEGGSDGEVEDEAGAAAAIAAARVSLTVAVSNEVGLGVVPATPLGRRYRDLLGRVNALWADAADRAAFVVAGRPLRLDSADELLEWTSSQTP
jgi:adenosylcobinamide kinase / adenosylcobinamide-phosphate guanylyltransferase